VAIPTSVSVLKKPQFSVSVSVTDPALLTMVSGAIIIIINVTGIRPNTNQDAVNKYTILFSKNLSVYTLQRVVYGFKNVQLIIQFLDNGL